MTLGFTSHRAAELLRLLGRPVPPTFPAHVDAALPLWLTPELLLGEFAETRLARWVTAGQPETPADDVEVIGDDLLVDAARRVLADLPPPVRYHLALHAVLHLVGHASGGHCAWSRQPRAGAAEWPRVLVVTWKPAPPRCPLRRWRLGQRILVRSGHGYLPEPADPMSTFEAFTAHECGHAWTGRAYPLEQCNEPVTTEAIHLAREDRERLVRLGAEWGLLERLAADSAREERLVARLVARWGYSGAAADCWAQGSAAHARVWNEASALAAVDAGPAR